MVKEFLWLASSSLSNDHSHVHQGQKTWRQRWLCLSLCFVLTLWSAVPNNRCTRILRRRTGCVLCIHRGDLWKKNSESRRVARSEKRPWKRGTDAACQHIESEQHHCSLVTHLFCVPAPFCKLLPQGFTGAVVVSAGTLTPANSNLKATSL